VLPPFSHRMRGMSLVILGVRHGEVHNPDGVIYAGLDGFGLSDTGRSQAKSVAAALSDLPVAAIYASPLDRAMETAGFVAEATGAEVNPDIRLHEWRHWQQWAGMMWEQLRTEGREAWEAYQRDPGSVTAGESLHELGDRMDSWLADVKDMHDGGEPDGPGKVVVGISHLEPLRTAVLRGQGRPPKDLFDVKIGLCEVVRIWPEPDASPMPLESLAAIKQP
jgi:broad specificity phosphatase PhoE